MKVQTILSEDVDVNKDGRSSIIAPLSEIMSTEFPCRVSLALTFLISDLGNNEDIEHEFCVEIRDLTTRKQLFKQKEACHIPESELTSSIIYSIKISNVLFEGPDFWDVYLHVDNKKTFIKQFSTVESLG